MEIVHEWEGTKAGSSIRNLNGRLNHLSTDLHFSNCTRVVWINSVGSSQPDKFNHSWRTANQVLVSLQGGRGVGRGSVGSTTHTGLAQTSPGLQLIFLQPFNEVWHLEEAGS